ncbi:MAG: AAA family ATPase [Opitutia bacterium]|jgi:ssDNA-binding Zn-finger/Zn-ribbon topoisomerase 1
MQPFPKGILPQSLALSDEELTALQALFDEADMMTNATPTSSALQQPTPLDLSKVQTGTRLRLHTGYTFGGFAIPAGAVAEVLSNVITMVGDANGVQSNGLQCRLGWRDWQGQPQQLAVAVVPITHLAFGRGRTMFPGEAPPKKGDTFGVTGKNNDYTKLAKQGKRSLVVPAVAETYPDPTAVPAVMPSPAAPTPSVMGSHLVGTSCPKCSSPMVLRSGVRKTDGKPFAFVGCSSFPSCRIIIKSDGAVFDGKVPFAGMMVSPAPTSSVVMPSTAPTPSVVSTPASPATPTPSVAGPTLKPKASKAAFVFPVDKAMKMAKDVRKMQKQGTSEMTFSLRKLLAWGTVASALYADGMANDDAVAAGFRLTSLDRETDESRDTLRTLFQSHFGYEVTKGDKHKAMQTTRLVETAIEAGLNLWLSGPTGCGKTHSVLEVLKANGTDYIRFQGGRDVTRETLVGYPGLTNGSSSFFYGPLSTAIRKGIPFILDEVDKLRDEVLSELAAVLEGNDLVLSDNGGERLTLPKGFCVIATANTVGRGEGTMYSGTGTVNEAIRDRFIFLQVDYDDAKDAAILTQHLATL